MSAIEVTVSITLDTMDVTGPRDADLIAASVAAEMAGIGIKSVRVNDTRYAVHAMTVDAREVNA